MTFNIIGEYCFKIPITTMFINEVIEVKHRNLITMLGEFFFLRRCIDDLYNPIQYICIGNGVSSPQKGDTKLGNETKRDTCIKDVDTDNKRLQLITSFESEDLIGASEIGVLTTNLSGEEILISHDVFNDVILNENFFNGVKGLITVEYSFYFSTSQIKTGWSQYAKDKNVYWVYEPNEVVKVYDSTTNYGLRRVSSITEVKDYVNSYYYDSTKTNNLYVHLYHKSDPDKVVYAPNPNNHNILVENR